MCRTKLLSFLKKNSLSIRWGETPSSPNLVLAAIGLLAMIFAGCSTTPSPNSSSDTAFAVPLALSNSVQRVKDQFAPDAHVVVFRTEFTGHGDHYILHGDVTNAEAKTALQKAAAATRYHVLTEINVLPSPELGENTWGIANLSVVNIREKPFPQAEMGSQALTGTVFRVWKKSTNWYLIQTPDNYVGWVEAGCFTNGNRAMVDHWASASHLIVTDYENRLLAQPDSNAPVVSDTIMGCQVERLGESGDWYQVGLPGGQIGYLPKSATMEFSSWKASRHPTADNIEKTAREFLGRPYFWGCNSIRGMDCSGMTKLVFFLNGIDLDRQASEQAMQGVEVPLGDDFSHLQKGDLLFFGRRSRDGHPEHVDHAAIYLGNKLFIQSAEYVRISSLDGESAISDVRHAHKLLHARRILPAP